ncbi:hypothetical protein ACFPM3_16095 [Streptomyces coeruleoprunus]|uniref:Uncharacterized protein n=1 Tax=Streptomyces coeruleoprunus TaxID=285563 RepID=A0ABV9XH57_9ACTN
MNEDHKNEPVFIRSRWGTRRYVYNPGNPIGLALIIGTLLFAGGMMYNLQEDLSWSEWELDDAVHAAARTLETTPQRLTFGDDYADLIHDAIDATKEGPSTHVKVSPEWGNGEDPTGDRFDIRTTDTKTRYCMTLTPPQPEDSDDPLAPDPVVTLSVQVTKGSC